jgi:hypothetical protein
VCGSDPNGQLEGVVRRLASCGGVASEPRGFRFRDGDRRDTRKLARRLGESSRLCEQGEHLRVAPSGAYEREHREGKCPGECRDGSPSEDEHRGFGRLRPAALIELETSAMGEEVELDQVVAVRPAVREPLFEEGTCGIVLMRPRRCPRARVMADRHALLETVLLRECHCAFERRQSPIGVGEQIAPRHFEQRLAENLRVVETLCQV